MAYIPNWLSGKNGFVLLGMGQATNVPAVSTTGMYINPATGAVENSYNLPTSESLGGAYTSTWAFGKWRLPIRTATPKVTNFTGVTSFAAPAGLTLSSPQNNSPTGPNSSGNFILAFQQVVAGVTSVQLQLEGPYDQNNMPLCSGIQYAFVLGLSSELSIAVIGLVDGLEPFIDVEGAEMIRVTAQSNGFFTPFII